tara:strand:+ start:258 stop:485 length:228 start_codon:yes stop_codon:yes gene_type:complete
MEITKQNYIIIASISLLLFTGTLLTHIYHLFVGTLTMIIISGVWALYLASRVRIGQAATAPNKITILGYELKEAD